MPECCSSSKDSKKSDHDHDHDDHHESSRQKILWDSIKAFICFVVLFAGIIMEHFSVSLFNSNVNSFIWYFVPYIFVGFPVIKKALVLMLNKDFFNELSLMSLATIGAFFIGQYAESLGVMVFYTIGEIVQNVAVNRTQRNIKALLDVRPDIAYVVRGDHVESIDPVSVQIGDILEIKAGEKAPLDGLLLSENAAFNTAALTGESVPRMIRQGQPVLAGMISTDKLIQIKVNKSYENSALSRILQMVQEASENKSPTEQFIRKFARIYTPIVFFLAVAIIVIPYFVVPSYLFQDWFYRALVFLVMSCPCALVISVPLGYFGGIGVSSRNGILFKGGNFLEAITNLKILVTDKTGTMTKGVFTVQNVSPVDCEIDVFLTYLASIEHRSNHPIAKAVLSYAKEKNVALISVQGVEEIAGYGIKAFIEEKEIIAGNVKLMEQFHITIPSEFRNTATTTVLLAYDHKFIGSVAVADEIKEDAVSTVQRLHDFGVKVIMLSGDKKSITESIGQAIGIDESYGDLLPDGKAQFIMDLKKNSNSNDVIAFVGDGINDAPVIALSDVGIAMGGLGSDLAVETADVIIQNDEPSKIPLAMRIAKGTRIIVMQNIVFAMTAKVVVLILGAGGMATMWEAVFADVGVSIIATLNSLRLQYKKFK